MNYCPVWFFVQSQTDRQTDGKRCIRPHRALAQVGSKTGFSAFIFFPPTLFHYSFFFIFYDMILTKIRSKPLFLFPASRSEEGELLNSPSSVRPSVLVNYLEMFLLEFNYMASRDTPWGLSDTDSRTNILTYFLTYFTLGLKCPLAR